MPATTSATSATATSPATRAHELPMVLEIKRTLAGREKRFQCHRLATDDQRSHAVLMFVAEGGMHVHGIDLPPGTVTFGHFWTDRLYNVYHWLDTDRNTIGFYFNLSDSTHIGDDQLEWRDLTVDILAVDALVEPPGRLEVLDEDELPADLDPDLRRVIEDGKASILDDPAHVIREIEQASRALFPLAFPSAA